MVSSNFETFNKNHGVKGENKLDSDPRNAFKGMLLIDFCSIENNFLGKFHVYKEPDMPSKCLEIMSGCYIYQIFQTSI